MGKMLEALRLYVFVAGVMAGPVVYAGDPTLVGWWKFDEGVGMTVRDSSSYRHDGALMGDPQWATGQIGSGALSFDGSGGLVEASESSVLDIDNALTITAWVNLNNLTTYYFVACKAPSGTAGSNFPGNYEFRVQVTDGLLQFGYQNTPGEVYVFHTSTAAIATGQWYHVAVTLLKGGQVEFYIDGISAGATAQTAEFGILNDEPIRIGGRKDNYSYFNGLIDDVRIYSRVLTLDELADVMLGKGPNAELADDPSPANEATDVPRDTSLAWEPGEFAATHDVYFGTAFDDVNDASRANPMGVLVSQGQAASSYDPAGVLDFETTYYWRIDEVNAPPTNTIFKGEVWSFTTEPVGYPIANVVAASNGSSEAAAGPQNTVNGSGLDAADQHSTVSSDMWLATPGTDPLWIQFEF
ncbi:MAG: LamG domain-containing protein, partial [Sedimentisphaerales bacterium]|nr:LamG domain-containing protein [Sedimentisphaerales bacterium]